VDGEPVVAHPTAQPNADGGNLFLYARPLLRSLNPDADPIAPRHPYHVEAIENVDDPVFEEGDEGPDVAEATAHVEHDVDNALAGAMVGILAATPSRVDGKARWLEQVLRIGAGASRVERGVLA